MRPVLAAALRVIDLPNRTMSLQPLFGEDALPRERTLRAASGVMPGAAIRLTKLPSGRIRASRRSAEAAAAPSCQSRGGNLSAGPYTKARQGDNSGQSRRALTHCGKPSHTADPQVIVPFVRSSFRDAAQRQARNPYSRGLCLWVPGSPLRGAPE